MRMECSFSSDHKSQMHLFEKPAQWELEELMGAVSGHQLSLSMGADDLSSFGHSLAFHALDSSLGSCLAAIHSRICAPKLSREAESNLSDTAGDHTDVKTSPSNGSISCSICYEDLFDWLALISEVTSFTTSYQWAVPVTQHGWEFEEKRKPKSKLETQSFAQVWMLKHDTFREKICYGNIGR